MAHDFLLKRHYFERHYAIATANIIELVASGLVKFVARTLIPNTSVKSHDDVPSHFGAFHNDDILV